MMKNLKGMRWFLTGGGVGLVLLALAFGGVSAKAQAPDAPVHRAARLSYLQGSVSVEHMDNTGSDPGLLNMPLAAGVRVATGEDGQAEIEFEDGSLVRLTPNSALEPECVERGWSGKLPDPAWPGAWIDLCRTSRRLRSLPTVWTRTAM